jgi:hypothetical protein
MEEEGVSKGPRPFPFTVDEVIAYDFPNYDTEVLRVIRVLEIAQEKLLESPFNVRYTILPLINNLKAWLTISFRKNKEDYRMRLAGSLRVRVCTVEQAMDLILKLNEAIKTARKQIAEHRTKLEVAEIISPSDIGEQIIVTEEGVKKRKFESQEALEDEKRELDRLEDLLTGLKRELISPRNDEEGDDGMSLFYNWLALCVYVVPSSYKSLNSNLRRSSLRELK